MARFVVHPEQGADVVDLKPTNPAEGLSLSRWSRLKRGGGETAIAPAPEGVAVPEAADVPVMHSSAAEATDAVELDLPQLSSISLAEDFTPFMQTRVPQALRQQALKALFKDPHFNVMDGLDTYIDDYTVFEPITPAVMATLSSWKTIMNPLEQVVTAGGHAVDVESEEGKAVLAARAETNALTEGLSSGNNTPHPDPLAKGETEPALLNANDDSTEPGAATAPFAGEECAEGLSEQTIATLSDSTAAPIQHHRHNKRVSDFSYADTPEVPPLGAEKAK